MNIFKRFTSFLKQTDIKNPFAVMPKRRFTESFGTTARQEFLQANKSWVFACVQAIAQEVSNIDLKLVEENSEGELEPVKNSDIMELLNKVNPRMTRHELFEITQSHLELDGNAFWMLARDKTDVIREIWPLRPDRVTIIQDKENALLVSGFAYKQRDGNITKLEAKDVIHFANFNAEGDYPFPVRGAGTVQAAALVIDTNNFSREWNRVFFQNSAIPNILLKTETVFDPDSFKQLQEKFNQSFQGLQKAHKPMLLEGGLELEQLTSSQRDMDFVNQLVSSRNEILGIFRVPQSILGITEDVNRANAEASIFTFMRGTITPKMQYIVDTLNEFLLPQFEGAENQRFVFESPVPENKEQKLAEFEKGHNNWLTTNDIRRELGLPETEEGDKILGPFSLVVVDSVEQKGAKKQSVSEKKQKSKKKSKEEIKTIEETTRKFVNDLFKQKNRKAKKEAPKVKEREQLDGQQVAKFIDIWKKGISERQDQTEIVIQGYFDDQEKRVLESVKDNLKGLKKKEYSLKQAEDLLPDRDEEIKIAIDLMTPLYEEFLAESGQQGVELVDIDGSFDPDTPEAVAFVETRGQFFAESINETTYKELIATLNEGIAKEETFAQLSERIAEVYGKTADFRTLRIARTEVSAISNFGNVDGMKQAGAPQKMWIVVTPQDDPCIIEGEIVGITETFSNGFDQPPVHPNCQCSTIPIF